VKILVQVLIRDTRRLSMQLGNGWRPGALHVDESPGEQWSRHRAGDEMC